MRDWVDEVLLDDALLWGALLGITIFSLATLIYPLAPGIIPEEMLQSSTSQLENIVEKFKYMLPLIIFLNNTLVALRDLLLSVTIVLPLLDVVYNGLLVGYIVVDVLMNGGLPVGPLFVLGTLAPHGALEIGAIAVAASTGLNLLRRPRLPFRRVLKRNLYLSVSLLLVAALAEVFVTPIAAIIALLLGGG